MKISALAGLSLLLSTTALAQGAAPDAISSPQSPLPPTGAESAPATPPNGVEGLEDIVVTAQKGAQAESIQKVPLAISAVTEETIKAHQLLDITDIGRLAPNVALTPASSFPAFANFFIRGIGLNGTVRTIDPSVAVITDGMVNEFLLGTVLDTFDVQSIEVLRGPQGILFGRNATGGAVSFTSRRPTNDLQIEGELRLGSFGRFDASGLVAGPIVSDKILGKIAVMHRSLDGYYKDRNGGVFVAAPLNPTGANNTATYTAGKDNTWIVRPTLVLRPTETLEISLIGEYFKETGQPGGGGRLVNQVANLQKFFGYTQPAGKYDINHDFVSDLDLEQTRVVIEAKLDVGVGIFTSISGYRDVDYRSSFDADGTPFPLFHFPKGNRDQSRQYSEEFRFASDFSDVVSFVVGGYYSDLSIETLERRQIGLFFTGQPVNTQIVQQGQFRQDSTSRAVFYNIEVRPIPEVRLSHGGRYTKDKKNIGIVPISVCPGGLFANCTAARVFRNAKFDDYSPRFTAEYQATPDVLLYASHTKGYRSGNFNGRAQNVAQIGPAQPETVKSIEGGVKSTFFSGRARFNLAVFTSDYKDIQRTVSVNGIQTLANAASATIKGIEAEGTVQPVAGLILNGSLGYLDAKFDEFLGLDVNGDGIPDPALAKLLKLERVPSWTGYAAVSYAFPIPRMNASIVARVDYAYQGSLYFDNLNEVRQDSVGLLGANLTLKNANWRLTVFGRNLTNEFYGEQGTRLTLGPPPTNRGFEVYGGQPRTFGVELGFQL